MSWLSKTSSNLLKVPTEVLQDIQDIVDEVINYIENKKKKPEAIGILKLSNPYTKKYQEIRVVILPESSNSMAIYNPGEKTISIFAYAQKTDNLESLKNWFIAVIRHEITHAVDPKFFRRKYSPKTEYLDLDYEFDGISAEIIQHINDDINDDINDQNKQDLLEWIKTPIQMPSILYPFKNYISYWKNNKPKWFRKLIQRIYNEVFNVREI